jgi:hypothetical protein
MMEPAASIIRKLGGPAVVAGVLRVNRSYVWRWSMERERGGTGGVIPQRHIPRLIKLAAVEGVPLTHAEFFVEANGANGSSGRKPRSRSKHG